ncbi:MAG: HEAT repeat domain-containing protein [Chitinivibrionales bacterium]
MGKGIQVFSGWFLLFCLLAFAGCREIDRYIEDLSTADSQKREQALHKLQEMGPGARKALPALQLATEDEDPRIRRLAVEALGAMGDEAWPAANSVVFCMEDKDLAVRRAAVDAIGRFNKLPSTAMPLLEQCLGDEDEIIRRLTLSVYVDLGQKSVFSLVRTLESENPLVRRTAVQALGMIGPDARRAESLLKKLSENDNDKQTRDNATRALKLISN